MRLNKKAISVIIILVSLATVVVMSGLNFIIPSKTREVADQNPEAEKARYGAGADKRGNISASMNKIFLTTKDGIRIAANLYSVEPARGWLVLVHMMPATKESYQELAQRFQNLGYESIAIDLRGHGESDKGPNGFLKFSDSDHQKSILDLEAAVNYLIENRGAVADKISFIGASIGANLSLQYISEHPEFETAILLSLGLNYRGIKTEPLVKNLKAGQKVFFISSRDDPNAENNVEENQKLYGLVPTGAEKKIQIYDVGGHGTNILENQPELMSLIIEFIK